MPRLTKGLIDSTPPQDKEVFLWDSEIKGFGLRVSPGGRKSYLVQYRNARGRTRRLTLGPHGTLTVRQARRLARVELGKVCAGDDPSQERKDHREVLLFAELAHEYMERHAKPRKRSWRNDQYMLDGDVLPHWKARPVDELRRADVVALVDRVVDRGAPIQANRLLRLVSKVFNFGIARGLVENNPAHKVELPAKPRSRTRVLTPPEIRAFWNTLAAEASPMAQSFQLRLLTAQRSGEVATMRWADIADPWWTIPATVAKNGCEHEVYLVGETRRLLERIADEQDGDEDSEWVFIGRRDSAVPMTHWGKALPRLRELAGVAHFTAHDLRRTVATNLAALGVRRVVIAKILNHTSIDATVTAVYDRYGYRKEKQEALQRWEERLLGIVS